MPASPPDTPPLSEILPGVHRVRKDLARGRVAEYWYAWRGGPQILKVVETSDARLAQAVAAAAAAAVVKHAEVTAPGDRSDSRFFHGLVTRYLIAMDEDQGLAPRTKSDRRKHLDRARAPDQLGEMEVRAFESRHARKFLIDWRDRFKATPKTADDLLGAVSTVLTWTVERGELARNPVEEFPRLYHVNRAEIVWEPHHLATLLQFADPEFALAVRFAALTGIREGDLMNVPWTAIGDSAIVWQTNKSNRRRTIVVPITPGLRALLAEIPKRATTILTSRKGKPWKAAGLAAGLRRARLAVLAHVQKVHGPETPSPIEGLRFHDLRGTAATNFIRAGLELSDVATILGWKLDRVREIATRYVTAQEIGLAMVQRINRNAREAKKAKGVAQ